MKLQEILGRLEEIQGIHAEGNLPDGVFAQSHRGRDPELRAIQVGLKLGSLIRDIDRAIQGPGGSSSQTSIEATALRNASD